jgi:hypothetical protein
MNLAKIVASPAPTNFFIALAGPLAADVVPDYVEAATVMVDANDAGIHNAAKLAALLEKRGISVELPILQAESAVSLSISSVNHVIHTPTSGALPPFRGWSWIGLA